MQFTGIVRNRQANEVGSIFTRIPVVFSLTVSPSCFRCPDYLSSCLPTVQIAAAPRVLKCLCALCCLLPVCLGPTVKCASTFVPKFSTDHVFGFCLCLTPFAHLPSTFLCTESCVLTSSKNNPALTSTSVYWVVHSVLHVKHDEMIAHSCDWLIYWILWTNGLSFLHKLDVMFFIAGVKHYWRWSLVMKRLPVRCKGDLLGLVRVSQRLISTAFISLVSPSWARTANALHGQLSRSSVFSRYWKACSCFPLLLWLLSMCEPQLKSWWKVE